MEHEKHKNKMMGDMKMPKKMIMSGKVMKKEMPVMEKQLYYATSGFRRKLQKK